MMNEAFIQKIIKKAFDTVQSYFGKTHCLIQGSQRFNFLKFPDHSRKFPLTSEFLQLLNI